MESGVFCIYASFVLNCEIHLCAGWMVGSLLGCITESVGCGKCGEPLFIYLHCTKETGKRF